MYIGKIIRLSVEQFSWRLEGRCLGEQTFSRCNRWPVTSREIHGENGTLWHNSDLIKRESNGFKQSLWGCSQTSVAFCNLLCRPGKERQRGSLLLKKRRFIHKYKQKLSHWREGPPHPSFSACKSQDKTKSSKCLGHFKNEFRGRIKCGYF